MFDPKNQSKAAQIFAAYRNENNHLLTKFRNIASYLKKLKELGEFERKEVVGGMFSLDNNLGPVFDSVNINIHRLVEIVDNLIKCLETEKKDLDKYMSGLKKATTESESQLEKLLINYNNEQYDYIQQLNTLVPGLIELAENAIGMEDETIADTADGVFKTYLTLENAILNEKMDKDSLYITFEKVLFKLRDNAKYLGDIVKKLDDEKSKNAKFFISNFRSIPSLLVDFEKHRVNCGRDKDKDKLFSDLKDDDAKVKLDKFMKEKLQILFHSTELKKGTENIKSDDAITKIIDISLSLKELEKLWKKLEQELRTILNKASLTFKKPDGKFLDLEFECKDGKYLKISEFSFRSEDKQENDLRYILGNLQDYLDGSEPWKGNEAFKLFLEKNQHLFVNFDAKIKLGKNRGSSGNSDVDDKLIQSIKNKFMALFQGIVSNGIDLNSLNNNNTDLTVLGNNGGKLLTGLVLLLFGDKSNIVEDNGKYTCDRFSAIIKEIDSTDKSDLNNFLKFVFDNFSALEGGDLKLLSTFLSELFKIISYVELTS